MTDVLVVQCPSTSTGNRKTTYRKTNKNKKIPKTNNHETTISSSSSDDEAPGLEIYNPSNRLLTREFIERVISKLCGYGLKIGSLEIYQLAFVHKSVYRKDISPPQSVVDDYLKRTHQTVVPLNPPPPIATYKGKGVPLVFTDNYEAMEFVGDGWIGAIIGQYNRSRFPGQSEKFYHNLKKHIVSKDGLSQLSAQLGFGDYALLSAAAEDLLTRNNPTLLEDIFEAFTCAVVEDLGVGVMRVMIKNIIESTIDFREAIINDDNYKDILQRICKENSWSIPGFIDMGDNGLNGAKREYSIGVLMIPEAVNIGIRGRTGFSGKGDLCDVWATGVGATKKKATQAAAFNALKALEIALQA